VVDLLNSILISESVAGLVGTLTYKLLSRYLKRSFEKAKIEFERRYGYKPDPEMSLVTLCNLNEAHEVLTKAGYKITRNNS
jgi:hypothetical protein